MKFPSLDDQLNDEQSLYRWFQKVILVRNSYPAIARGATKKADPICDDKVAAFYRSADKENELLIVMNLRGQTAEKDLSASGRGFKLAEKLCTNDENITYRNGTLTLPAYSIAVLTHR